MARINETYKQKERKTFWAKICIFNHDAGQPTNEPTTETPNDLSRLAFVYEWTEKENNWISTAGYKIVQEKLMSLNIHNMHIYVNLCVTQEEFNYESKLSWAELNWTVPRFVNRSYITPASWLAGWLSRLYQSNHQMCINHEWVWLIIHATCRAGFGLIWLNSAWFGSALSSCCCCWVTSVAALLWVEMKFFGL